MTGSKRWVGKARWGLLLLFLLAIGIGSAYLAAMLNVRGGRPVAPLDDSYIFYQYARQIAQGHPWQYNSGDPPSTGMTSLIYPWFLAGLYRLGVQGEQLVLVAVASGLVWLPAIAFATLRVWGALDICTAHSNRWGLIAALIVLTTGLIQWGAFLGMETGFFTLLLLCALDALLRRHMAWAAFWLSLAGLTRPEGLVLALLALVIRVAASWRERALSKPSQFLEWLPLGAAVGAGLVPLLMNWLLTGTPSATGLQAKSWFYNVPLIWGDVLQSVLGEYRIMLLRTFNGWDGIRTFSTNLVAPGLALTALVGWGVLARQRRWWPFLLTAAWFWIGALSTATLITANWHLGRYQAPLVPLAVIMAVVGLAAVWESAASAWNVRRVLAGLLLLWLWVGSWLSTCHALSAFRQTTQTVAHQQLVLADWMRTNLPPDARVGVHDTGSLRYVGERPTYDVVGLTTAETTLAWRNGSGSLFEQMEHSSRRPDYFAIYPDVFSVPYLAATDLFARELFRVEVSDYAVASASAVQGVWQADWRLAGSGERFYQADILERTRGLRQVDALDVADLHDEAAHHLRWWHDRRWPGFPTEVQQLRYHTEPGVTVLEGGRLVSGGMSFQVKTQPKAPLWIVARLHAREAGVVRVLVNGRNIGRWAYAALPGEWLETLFAVPSDAVLDDKTEIRLQVDSPSPDFRHYAPYYFWFLQGEPEASSVVVRHPLDVVFNSEVRLLGYDLEQPVLHPGETLSVTLYWQATASAASAAKVFVHLYDARGRLVSQVDGWPMDGTRPPYTWSAGEVIRDRRRVLLPLELLPGHYSLQVGLYDREGRLVASSATLQPFFENRVPLAEIEIKSP